MIYLGIDIGLTGAIGACNERGWCATRDLATVPWGKSRRLDGRALADMLLELVPAGEPCMLAIEDVRPRSIGNEGKATNSMHSQGSMMRSRGVVEGVADVLRVKITAVQPATWKRHFGLIGTKKSASVTKAQLLHPMADISLQKHDNRAEALLIAHWLRSKYA